ncbi:hypothetical protein ACS0TY_018949 [Phlomoides rotata]
MGRLAFVWLGTLMLLVSHKKGWEGEKQETLKIWLILMIFLQNATWWICHYLDELSHGSDWMESAKITTLSMENACKDWGPRPFRFINAWVKHPNFKEFFESKWYSYQVNGWAVYRLKEKLKSLRSDLEVWNKEREIELWDRIDDTLGLDENEVTSRNRCLAELLRYAHWKDNFLFQKAKVKWLLEGDVNSGFFHGWINKCKKVNEIDGLYFEGVWTESVEGVKNEVQTHFLKHFKSPKLPRPNTTRLLFTLRIDESSNQLLTTQFSEEEIKDAIWSCDSNRSPGPDRFTFSFIKDQWEVLKEEIMNMMHEFHQNGSCLMEINIASDTLEEMADYLGCDIGQQPLSYLRLNVGINH